jgi:ABC-type transport system involved in cytochrome bd biosynthesis fused ATPase/permease subunit
MTEQNTFQFLLSWFVLLLLLILANKSRLGHVIIYYALLLLIVLILVSEYKQVAPIIGGIQSIGQFNASQSGA